MVRPIQPDKPTIRYVDTEEESTLYIDEAQAMQAWEEELMRKSADLLCEFGDTFLEVGLGMGFSALHIANHPGTKSHTVVEKYPEVTELLRKRLGQDFPKNLTVVHADIFDYVETIEPERFDGIFFDPELPSGTLGRPEIADAFMPKLLRGLRRGGAFIPFFTVEPALDDWYLRFFKRIVVVRHPFEAYENTNYTFGVKHGDAFIQAFIKE